MFVWFMEALYGSPGSLSYIRILIEHIDQSYAQIKTCAVGKTQGEKMRTTEHVWK